MCKLKISLLLKLNGQAEVCNMMRQQRGLFAQPSERKKTLQKALPTQNKPMKAGENLIY